MQKYRIVDNFLSEQDLKEVKKNFLSKDFPWFHKREINELHTENDLNSYFIHMLYDNSVGWSNFHHFVIPILEKIKPKILLRIKCNLYYRTEKLENHKPHIDYDIPHQGAIFYLNTNDGKTILEDGTQIDSIENRMLFFEAYKLHSSTSTTNQKARININFNYI